MACHNFAKVCLQKTCNIAMLLACVFMFCQLASAQDTEQKKSERYWYTATAEWVLGDDGKPDYVLVRGQSNLPAGTIMQADLVVRSMIPLVSGKGKCVLTGGAQSVHARVPHRGGVAGGVAIPEIVSRQLSTFEFKTVAIDKAEIVPATFEVYVELYYDQPEGIDAVLTGAVEQENTIVNLPWGLPETLESYTATIRKRFERDFWSIEADVADLEQAYSAMQAEELSIFELSKALDVVEANMLLRLQILQEIPISLACSLSGDYHRAIRSTSLEYLTPLINAMRKEIEQRNAKNPFDVHESYQPKEWLLILHTVVAQVYDKFELTKQGAESSLLDLRKMLVFFEALPERLREFKKQADRAGFEQFVIDSTTDLAILLGRLSNTVPSGDSKASLLESMRLLYTAFVTLDYDDINEAKLESFVKDLAVLKETIALVEKLFK